MRTLIWILTIVLLFSCAEKKNSDVVNQNIELEGKWEFKQSGTEKWFPATVPGVVHTDLLANNLIEDPFWENNEQQLQWIEKEDWTYRTTFNISREQLQNEHIEILFEGLDTYAALKLNGELILSTTNMFRQWKTEIKRLLKEGENKLEITFTSPLKYNKDKYDSNAHQLPSGSETVEPRVGSFTRKAAYHFGWDWGPRFVTCGIWRPVKINCWNTARITDVYCKTLSISENKAEMMASITIEADVKYDKLTTVQLQINDTTLLYGLKKGSNTINYPFTVNNPKLWWSNGLGEAHLYSLKVALTTNNNLTQKQEIKYGIRTIELVNKPDSTGTSFYFKLNGRPVFMKGANYIPQDVFLPRVKEKQYEKLIKDVKNANMNMLISFTTCVIKMEFWFGKILCLLVACTQEILLL
jgi:beta-mannosidase